MMLRFLYNNLLRSTTGHHKLDSTQLLKPKSFSTKSQHDNVEILSLLRSYGFTEPQISNLMEKKPLHQSRILAKTLKPKLDFFNSIGVSATDLTKILKLDATLLHRSLENGILPSYNFLKTVLLTNENVVAAIKKSSRVLYKLQYMAPNIEFVRGLGVPESRILSLVRSQPRLFLQKNPDHFEEIIRNMMRLGFDPSKCTFMMALRVFTGLSNSKREQKFEVFRKWGWSEDEILSAFRKEPGCMTLSANKIDQVMDFVVNKMGWDPSDVVGCPSVITHSLENWTMPRCLVVGELLSKGLIKKDFKLITFIQTTEKRFLDKFVTKYCTENPELLKLYKTKVEAQGFIE